MKNNIYNRVTFDFLELLCAAVEKKQLILKANAKWHTMIIAERIETWMFNNKSECELEFKGLDAQITKNNEK